MPAAFEITKNIFAKVFIIFRSILLLGTGLQFKDKFKMRQNFWAISGFSIDTEPLKIKAYLKDERVFDKTQKIKLRPLPRQQII